MRSEINDKFLPDIETVWTCNFKGDVYHLFNPQEDAHGNKSFDAVLDFFHYFNGIWHVDEVDDQSMTINDSIRPLFDGKDYALSIIDNFYANTMNYSKQQNSTERFLYFIGRHNAEFNIPIGTKTVQIRNRIGVRRNDVLIHEDDKLIDFNIDTSSESFCTAIEGYYDFQPVDPNDENNNETEPKQMYPHISPMASKYGIIPGEPIYDERYSDLDGIREACIQKQESTYQTSFSINAELFDVALNEGDEVRFVVPSKSINGYIRVVDITEDFDEYGDLIAASYTFGNENIANQYRKMQYDAIQDISDIMNGKKPIPFSVLPKGVREATNVINAGDTTQFYYRNNGIYGVNTENPLGVTRYNANGLGFSQDGGQNYDNALTYLGIVATAITSGTIDTNNVTIYGSEGYNRIEITGDKIKVWDSRDPEIYTEIKRGSFHSNKGAFSLLGYDGRKEYLNGIRQYDQSMIIQQFNNRAIAQWTDRDMTTKVSEEWARVYVVWESFDGQFLRMSGTARLGEGSTRNEAAMDIRIWQMGEDREMVRQRKVITKSFGVETGWAFDFDLKDFFSKNTSDIGYPGYPDKRELNLYVEFKLASNPDEGDTGVFRVNRGWMYG